MAESGCLRDVHAQNLEVDGRVALRDSNVVVRTATTAHDLTAVTHNTTVIYTGAQAGNITLPQATAANVGLTIKIIFAAAASATAFKLGFADSGSTVLVGKLATGLSAGGAAKENVSFAITSNAKALVIDSDAVDTAGGDAGSTYEFIYYGANTVYVDAFGMVSGTTATGPTADASVTTGI